MNSVEKKSIQNEKKEWRMKPWTVFEMRLKEQKIR